MPISHDLTLFEGLLHGAAVTVLLDLIFQATEDTNLVESVVRQALKITLFEHPAMRLVKVPKENPISPFDLRFEECTDVDVLLNSALVEDKFDGECADMERYTADYMNKWSNTGFDLTKSLFYLHFVRISSLPEGQRCLLYFIFNHSILDGPGSLTIAHSFCGYLARILGGENVQEPTAKREYIDIIARRTKFPDPASIPNFDFPERFLPHFTSTFTHTVGTGSFITLFSELDKQTTQSLIEACRAYHSTVQGALSVSAIVANFHMLSDSQTLPQDVLISAPMNMRSVVSPPCDANDVVFGASSLWWHQNVDLKSTLWALTGEATRHIKTLKESEFPFVWWERMMDMSFLPKIPAATLLASSIGVDPVLSQYGDRLIVKDVKFLSGQYDNKPMLAYTATHAHTFDERLHLSMAYSVPSIPDSVALEYSTAILNILRKMSESGSEDVTLEDALNFLKKVSVT